MPSATALAVSALRNGRARTARNASCQISVTGPACRAAPRGSPGLDRVRRLSGVAQEHVVDDHAVTHDQHPVRVCRDARVVRHQDRRLVLVAAQPRQQRHDLVAARPVKVAGGLVRQQQRRRCGERACQRDALLLAPGDLFGAMTLEAVQIELVHERAHPITDHLPRQLLTVSGRRLVAQAQGQPHVLSGGEHGEEVEELEDHADVVTTERGARLVIERVHIDPLDGDRPLVWWLQASEHVQQSALSAAARSHDRDEVPGFDGQRHTANRLTRRSAHPEDLVEIGGHDDAAVEGCCGRFGSAELSQGAGPFRV